jgi:hypothetical protein
MAIDLSIDFAASRQNCTGCSEPATHRQRAWSSSRSCRKLGGRSSTLLRRADDVWWLDVWWSDNAGPTQASRASNGLHDAMCVSGLASDSRELLDVTVSSSGGRPMPPRALPPAAQAPGTINAVNAVTTTGRPRRQVRRDGGVHQ